MLRLRENAKQIPLFLLYSSDDFLNEKGDIEFRHGIADRSIGDAGAVYLFFLMRGERKEESFLRAAIQKIDHAAARKEDSAVESLEDLFSLYDSLKEIRLVSAEDLSQQKKTAPEEYEESVAETAEVLLWDAEHADEITTKLVDLKKMLVKPTGPNPATFPFFLK